MKKHYNYFARGFYFMALSDCTKTQDNPQPVEGRYEEWEFIITSNYGL